MVDKVKTNIIMGDCDPEELRALKKGLEQSMGVPFEVVTQVSNGSRSGKLDNIKRYMKYFFIACKTFVRRKEYGYIVGWQQFHALIFSFFCSVLHVKKTSTVCALNFTYKEKKGVVGRIYHQFMRRCLDPQYMDYIHVPSEEYKVHVCKQFSLNQSSVIVAPFGIEDIYGKYSGCPSPVEGPYAMSIGRSNRDFDFLLKAWEKIDFPLVLISDSYKMRSPQKNVQHLTTISGKAQFPYIANCKLLLIPIDDATICSGDTVLLKAMALERPVVVTAPSTLAEMYVEDGVTGFCLPKEPNSFVKRVTEILKDQNIGRVGVRARATFLEKFSREKLGARVGQVLKDTLHPVV